MIKIGSIEILVLVCSVAFSTSHARSANEMLLELDIRDALYSDCSALLSPEAVIKLSQANAPHSLSVFSDLALLSEHPISNFLKASLRATVFDAVPGSRPPFSRQVYDYVRRQVLQSELNQFYWAGSHGIPPIFPQIISRYASKVYFSLEARPLGIAFGQTADFVQFIRSGGVEFYKSGGFEMLDLSLSPDVELKVLLNEVRSVSPFVRNLVLRSGYFGPGGSVNSRETLAKKVAEAVTSVLTEFAISSGGFRLQSLELDGRQDGSLDPQLSTAYLGLRFLSSQSNGYLENLSIAPFNSSEQEFSLLEIVADRSSLRSLTLDGGGRRVANPSAFNRLVETLKRKKLLSRFQLIGTPLPADAVTLLAHSALPLREIWLSWLDSPSDIRAVMAGDTPLEIFIAELPQSHYSEDQVPPEMFLRSTKPLSIVEVVDSESDTRTLRPHWNKEQVLRELVREPRWISFQLPGDLRFTRSLDQLAPEPVEAK